MQLPDGERIRLGFELVRDLSTQLITLATGVAALTIASAERGMLYQVSPGAQRAARIGWGCCLVSALMGVVQIMSLTGALLPGGGVTEPISGVPPLARLAGAIQIFTFLLGLGALSIFASQVLGRTAPAETAGEIPQQLDPHPPVHPTAQTPEVPVAATTAAAVEPETGKAPAPDSRHGPETTPESNTDDRE